MSVEAPSFFVSPTELRVSTMLFLFDTPYFWVKDGGVQQLAYLLLYIADKQIPTKKIQLGNKEKNFPPPPKKKGKEKKSSNRNAT